MSIKNRVKELLDEKKFVRIARLAESERGVIRYLFFFLYSTDDLLHWRAAEALGTIAAHQAGQKGLATEGGRNIPRRLVWSLAEESGATAFPATEALGAVASASPNNFPDFGRIVLSFIDDPTLRRGVLWSARKIAEKRPDLVWDSIPKLVNLLKDPDPTFRGHAAWALGATRDETIVDELKKIEDDKSPLFIYEDGELRETTVGKLAKQSIAELRKIP